jgi:hypothetical protein
MLFQLQHLPGSKSPKFNVLVEQCAKNDILRDKEIRKRFDRGHAFRTRGQHRLERIPNSEISQIFEEDIKSRRLRGSPKTEDGNA